MAAKEHSLRYLDHDSVMHRMYPLVKFGWVVVMAVGLISYRSPLSGAIMLVIVLLMAVFLGRVSLGVIASSSKVIFTLAVLLMIFHFFADPGNTVWQLGVLRITDGGLREGPIFFFRVSVIVLASFLLIWTTHPRDLMVSLAKAGIPYRYAFTVFLAMRFLPVVQREVDTVRAAHSIRGRAARTGLAHRVKLIQRYIFTILVNGLRKAESTATAIECRGFGAYPDRTYAKPLVYHGVDILLVVLFIVVEAGLIYWERVGS